MTTNLEASNKLRVLVLKSAGQKSRHGSAGLSAQHLILKISASSEALQKNPLPSSFSFLGEFGSLYLKD